MDQEEYRRVHARRAMVRRTWIENGGGQHGPRIETMTIPEANFDAFVEAATLSIKADNDRRVTELLEANNRYLERARSAERELARRAGGAEVSGAYIDELALEVADEVVKMNAEPIVRSQAQIKARVQVAVIEAIGRALGIAIKMEKEVTP